MNQGQRFLAFHAFGVGGEGLGGDAAPRAFESRGIQRSFGGSEELRRFVNLRVVVGLIDFDEGGDRADARVVIGGDENEGGDEKEEQAAHANKGTVFPARHTGVAAAHGKDYIT